MKRASHTTYWQLDLFMVLMIGSLLVLMWAGISPAWETVVAIIWATLVGGGMAAWLWANWAALEREESDETDSDASARGDAEPQTLPRTPVQEHFLAVMDHNSAKERSR